MLSNQLAMTQYHASIALGDNIMVIGGYSGDSK